MDWEEWAEVVDRVIDEGASEAFVLELTSNADRHGEWVAMLLVSSRARWATPILRHFIRLSAPSDVLPDRGPLVTLDIGAEIGRRYTTRRIGEYMPSALNRQVREAASEALDLGLVDLTSVYEWLEVRPVDPTEEWQAAAARLAASLRSQKTRRPMELDPEILRLLQAGTPLPRVAARLEMASSSLRYRLGRVWESAGTDARNLWTQSILSAHPGGRGLSDRRTEILNRSAEGQSTREIAEAISTSVSVVRYHLGSLLAMALQYSGHEGLRRDISPPHPH